LRAAVQHNDKRRIGRKPRRRVAQHPQVARVGSEAAIFIKPRGDNVRVACMDTLCSPQLFFELFPVPSEVGKRLRQTEHEEIL
jgi:hypothetical protein